MDKMICSICGHGRHWCTGINSEGEQCGEETGHYGTTPAKYCDDCRYVNIMNLGVAGDEPPELKNHLNEMGLETTKH